MSKALQLNDTPPESLSKIFGYPTVPDILGLNWLVRLPVPLLMNFLTRSLLKVYRTFHDMVSGQPHLRYKCELTAAGLLDNQNAPGTLFDRRTRLRTYR